MLNQPSEPSLEPVQTPVPHESMLAVRLWNTMGGQIDWAALPVLVEIHDIDDIEMMIEQLVIIREAKNV